MGTFENLIKRANLKLQKFGNNWQQLAIFTLKRLQKTLKFIEVYIIRDRQKIFAINDISMNI